MVINIIKSVLFNLHFYILTFLLIIVMSPVLILPFWFIKIIAKIWGKILVFGMKIWLGLNLKIIGNYNKDKPCIIAVKHQSAWETVICTSIFEHKYEHMCTRMYIWAKCMRTQLGMSLTDLFLRQLSLRHS